MALATGSRIGAYEILGPLGSGGMGEVYRARDARLGREVALKVLPAAFATDPDRRARFDREARVVAGLNHPNVVTLYSVEDDAGVRFLTMELVDGEGLDRVIAAGRVPAARVVELAAALADALVAAHEKGVVHRDLKPGNVMVTRDGRLKVLDFGLAKAAAPDSTADATQWRTVEAPLSGAGLVLGTAPYMAPEQVRGETVDARTDLFAFGVIAYELASGRRPFGGATFADVSSAILRDAPAPLAPERRDLPEGFERIVRRCLEKAPRDRFTSAAELRAELRRLAPAAGSGTRASRDAEPPSIAVLPFSNMSADPENEFFSDGLSEELLNALSKIPGLNVTGRTSSFAFKGKREDLRDIGHKLGVATLLEGSVRKAGSRVRITAQLVKVSDGFHLWSETYDRVLDDIFAVQDDIARAVSTALHVTLLGAQAPKPTTDPETYEKLLRAFHLSGQFTESGLAGSVALFRSVLAKHPDEARAWAGLARARAAQYGWGIIDTVEGQREAREALDRALALDDSLAEAHEGLGWFLLTNDYDWDGAEREFRRALSIAPGNLPALNGMAFYLACRGRLEEAREVSRRSIELDPLAPFARMNHGRIEAYAGDYAAAHRAYGEAVELAPEIASGYAFHGYLAWLMNRPEEALADIERERAAGYRHCATGIVCHGLGRAREADEALANLIALGEHWGVQIAAVYAARGEADRAFEWLDRSFVLHDSGLCTVAVNPFFQPLRSDARWRPFLVKMGLAG